MNNERLNLFLRLESCQRLLKSYKEEDYIYWPYNPEESLKEEIREILREIFQITQCFSCDKWAARFMQIRPWCNDHKEEALDLCWSDKCRKVFFKKEFDMDRVSCPLCFSLKEVVNEEK